MSGAQVRDIMAELRRQHWEVTLTTGDKVRAVPPDQNRSIVTFLLTANDVIPVIRELRQQGFVWPPRVVLAPDERVTATPFAPKPHPHTSTEPQQPASIVVNGQTLQRLERPIEPSQDAAVLFVALRDAKEYERLAAAEMNAAADKVREAQQHFSACKRTWDDAAKSLKETRAAFDRAFEAEKGVSP